MPTFEKQPDNIQAKELLTGAFLKLKCDLRKDGISDSVIEDVFRRHAKGASNFPRKSRLYCYAYGPFVLTSILLSCVVGCVYNDLRESKCLLEKTSFIVAEVTRPLSDCSHCRGLTSVPVTRAISQKDFTQNYAFTGVPLLVKDATHSWKALHSFSYGFFKALYEWIEDAYKITLKHCQFFAYNTEFGDLEKAFNMSPDRADYKPGEEPWYFGWSNCVPEIRKVLRTQYSTPYFLPGDSESSIIDWIFMGGPGIGAFIHLDYVFRPSWQAQIKGKKTWYLYPLPECESECSNLNVTMETGDIFLVDTTRWFHATFIHPGDISITIGSEYD